MDYANDTSRLHDIYSPFLSIILKWSGDCLLYTKKETNCGLFIANT